MNANNEEIIDKVAAAVRARVVSGAWSTVIDGRLGIPVSFDGEVPSHWLTPAQIEERIADVELDTQRRQMQLRLGLGPYRAWASRDRQQAINDELDATPPHRRGAGYRSPRPTRSSTDRLSREIAGVLLSEAPIPQTPQHDSVRELYSRSISLPAGNVGPLREVHRRVIRSNVDGLDRIVIHQTEHWNTTAFAAADALGDISIRTDRVRTDTHNGIVGQRNDLIVTFPPMMKGERRELTWLRTRDLNPGWLPDDQSFVFSSAPDHPTERMKIEVRFGDGAHPANVFRFANVYEGDRLAENIPMDLVPVRNGAIRCEWFNPAIGRSSGVRAWWPKLK